MIAPLRIFPWQSATVATVIAPLMKIPQRLEALAQEQRDNAVRHFKESERLHSLGDDCLAEVNKAATIAEKIKALLS